ncbi:hypothetical protein [Halorussus halobius]|uniref:hypothetical protein n=1 Tax=Halorussus halobius TaxID=1710537 RepID=UPI00143CC2AE|nr:hypothetical protein [Halorussus halobius]
MVDERRDAFGEGDDADARTERPPVGFGVAVGLLAVAFVGAATAGVLDAVGPYLVGVAALVGALFGLVRW